MLVTLFQFCIFTSVARMNVNVAGTVSSWFCVRCTASASVTFWTRLSLALSVPSVMYCCDADASYWPRSINSVVREYRCSTVDCTNPTCAMLSQHCHWGVECSLQLMWSQNDCLSQSLHLFLFALQVVFPYVSFFCFESCEGNNKMFGLTP
jgi:hypothetical protein